MKIINRFRNTLEKYLRSSVFSGFIFKNKPVILTDKFGMRFILYPWTHEPLEKLFSRRYIASEYEAISKFLKSGNTVLDIGANIGTHSIYMSKIVNDNGKVYAFEPVSETAWQLKENLALNKTENVEVITSAASEKDGVEKMNIFPVDFSAWNSFGIPDTNESKPITNIEVKTCRLDTFLSERSIGMVDFLKIDAEGAEKKVFKGAENSLKNGKIRVLSFEVSQIPLKAMGSNPRELFNILDNYGYKSYKYDARSKKFIGPIDDTNEQCENFYASRSDLTKL